MNNCYGVNNDMQMPLIKVFPVMGNAFYMACCTEDTDSVDRMIENVSAWMEYNARNVEHFELISGVQKIPYLHLTLKAKDMDQNEFEVYPAIELERDVRGWFSDYFLSTCFESWR